MSLTDDQILYIRDFIGDAEPPDDFDLEDIYTRVGSLNRTAYVVLTNRLANYLSTAASYSIIGVYQESTQANIDNLRQLLKDMEATYPDVLDTSTGGSSVRVSHLVRYGRAR